LAENENCNLHTSLLHYSRDQPSISPAATRCCCGQLIPGGSLHALVGGLACRPAAASMRRRCNLTAIDAVCMQQLHTCTAPKLATSTQAALSHRLSYWQLHHMYNPVATQRDVAPMSSNTRSKQFKIRLEQKKRNHRMRRAVESRLIRWRVKCCSAPVGGCQLGGRQGW
jgi:hypothetical protein